MEFHKDFELVLVNLKQLVFMFFACLLHSFPLDSKPIFYSTLERLADSFVVYLDYSTAAIFKFEHYFTSVVMELTAFGLSCLLNSMVLVVVCGFRLQPEVKIVLAISFRLTLSVRPRRG